MFDSLNLTLAQDGPPPPPSNTVAPAQTVTTGEGQPLPAPNQAPARTPFGDPIMLVLLAFMAFIFIFTMMSSRKEKKRKAELLASLKKGSKVRTIGGAIGSVVELRDDNTVVVKVDENTNTRIKFDRNAIATVLEEKGE